MENGIIHVRQGVTFTKTNGLYVDRPKSEKSVRSIPLPKILVTALQGHKERMMLEGNYWPDGPVFCTTKGTRIIPRNFNRVFQRLRWAAGIEDVNLHALRHTFAIRLLEAGETLKVVQELLGHSKISITGDIYSHVSPEIMRRAADKMDEILGIKMESKQGPGNDPDL